MATLTTARQLTGLDPERWRRIGGVGAWSAAGWVIVAAVLVAVNRLGGLATTEPRAFTRLGVVVAWGWLGMALVAWVFLAVPMRQRPTPAFRSTLAVAGAAHLPLAALAVTLLISAGLLQLLWPGFIMAIFTLGFWMPASLFTGLRVSCAVSTGRALGATAASYAGWLLVVGRHLGDQLGHLV